MKTQSSINGIIFWMLMILLTNESFAQVIHPSSIFLIDDNFQIVEPENVRREIREGLVATGEESEMLVFHDMNTNGAIFPVLKQDLEQGWRVKEVTPYGRWQQYYCGLCGKTDCTALPRYADVSCRTAPAVIIENDGSQFYIQENGIRFLENSLLVIDEQSGRLSHSNEIKIAQPPYAPGDFEQNIVHPNKGTCKYKVTLERVVSTTSEEYISRQAPQTTTYGMYDLQYDIKQRQIIQQEEEHEEHAVDFTWLMDTSKSMDEFKTGLSKSIPSLINQVLSRTPIYSNYAINADGVSIKNMDWSKLSSRSDLGKVQQGELLAKTIERLPRGTDDEKPFAGYINFLSTRKSGSMEHTHQYLILFTDEDDISEYSAKTFIEELQTQYPQTAFTLIVFSNPLDNKKYTALADSKNVRVVRFHLLHKDMNGFYANLNKLATQINVKAQREIEKIVQLKIPSNLNLFKVLGVFINKKKYTDYMYDPANSEVIVSFKQAQNLQIEVIVAATSSD